MKLILKKDGSLCSPLNKCCASIFPFCANLQIKLAQVLLAMLALFISSPAWAQAPGLAWATNVNARAFAIDSQTNIYTTTNGEVIILNASGAIVQSNSICPLPAIAQRDASGNYYFLGSFDGPQNFGGITLVGGWTNGPNGGAGGQYTPGWPTCFLAKYAGNGTLVWVISFGGQSYKNKADDLALNSDGSVTVGYENITGDYVALFSASGATNWQTSVYQNFAPACMKVTALNGTNGLYLAYNGAGSFLLGGTYTSAGAYTQLGGQVFYNSSLAYNAEPLSGTNHDIFITGLALGEQSNILTKWNSQGQEFSETLPGAEPYQLAEDAQANIYIAATDGTLSKYNVNGVLVWSNNYGSPVVSMIFDAQGNRYISRADGSVAKLQADAVPAPLITDPPIGGEVFAGGNFTFTVGASGYPPLNYYWFYQSNMAGTATFIPGATNSTLTLSNTTTAQDGYYSVLVSNVAGTVGSTPVLLTVKDVEVFEGSTMLTNGTYNFANPPTLSIRSAFTNGEMYYTLDGSTPSFSSTPYSGPFTLTSNATINAIGYSADFSQSAYADTVLAIVPPQYKLTASTAGGGTITLNPPGGSYASNTTVTAMATPASGYSFLYWQGAASGNNPSANVLMNQNQTLTAVFGTTLSTTVAGNGQLLLSPPGGLYPYGTTVRIEALPASGNYFGVWGNAASGSANPLYFTITNATPTVSSLFAALGTNQSALTLLVRGQGKAGANPAGNVFAINQSVTITATPNAGQTFLYWSGDASGAQNPLTVGMSQSRVITAHFSGQSVSLGSAGGYSSKGFQLNVVGDPQAVSEIFDSTDLLHWQSIGWVTNNSGETAFMDPSATNAPAKFYRAELTQ